MKEQLSNQKKTFSRANTNLSFFQKKPKKEPFIKSQGSENILFNKRESFFPPPLFSNSTPNQKKENKNIPTELQTKMENSFGHDFSNVKIQKNSQEAVKLNARAFTQGDSVHFAPNEFNPNSDKGKELISHEFAHVKQQREGRVKSTLQTKKYNINDDATLEKEADSYGKKALRADSMKETNFSKTYIVFSKSPNQTIQKRDVKFINYNDVARDIYHAINGIGTDEEKVYSALSRLRRNPVAINKLKSVYKNKYKSDLVTDLTDDFSGDELVHVQSLLATGETTDIRKTKTIDYSKIAIKIHDAIDGAGTDEEAVYQGLLELNNNPVLIGKLKKEYKSKYKVDLYSDIVSDFSGDELAHVLELMKDKTAKEQVNVSSKKEIVEVKKIIKSIKDDYGIDINSKAGIDAIKKQYTSVPTKVLDQLNTTAWEYKEIVALKVALENFAPILGDKRKKSKRKGIGQEVTSIGKVDQAIDFDEAKGQLDTTTIGEYFGDSSNFSLFTTGGEGTVVFPTNEKEIQGTTVHEITHGLLAYKLSDFVASTDYWLDKNTASGVAGAENPITNYGKTDASEDLSESVMYYFVDPATLKTACPKRYQFIKDTIKDWK